MEIRKIPIMAGILVVGALFLFGCNTAKGAAKGVVAGLGSAVGSTAKGAAKDVEAASNCIKKTDAWIKKNLW